jgi:hypothetical protein
MRKLALVLVVAGLGLALSCNSKSPITNACHVDKDCADGGTCDNSLDGGTFRCILHDGGAGGTGGKTDGGGGSGGHPFRCDASMQCSTHAASGGPVCEIDAASCVECVKDMDCPATSPICGSNKCRLCANATPECKSSYPLTPICVSNGTCVECVSKGDCTTTPKPACDTSVNKCVGCLASSDCSGTSPICNVQAQTCRACQADAECTAAPGVCMTDGHCATDPETVYVQPSANSCVSGATSGGGTSATPFCHLGDAISLIEARDLIVLRGGSIVGGVTIQSAQPISIVGQNASAIVTVDSGQSGLHVIGSDVYVRGVEILGISAAATIGIIADTNATIRLDGVTIENMPQGALRVSGSGYDVINSIFAGNGGTLDDGGRQIGGAFLGTPSSAQLSRFAFNTVVNSKEAGVICAGTLQTIDASLLAGNLGGGGTPDYSGCTLSPTSKALGTGNPMLTPAYRLMAASPCVDFVTTPPTNAPHHDIDAVTRPQGAAFDCGASEYKPPPP